MRIIAQSDVSAYMARRSKLSDFQQAEVVRRVSSGELTQAEAAEEYGLSRTGICRMLQRHKEDTDDAQAIAKVQAAGRLSLLPDEVRENGRRPESLTEMVEDWRMLMANTIAPRMIDMLKDERLLADHQFQLRLMEFGTDTWTKMESLLIKKPEEVMDSKPRRRFEYARAEANEESAA